MLVVAAGFHSSFHNGRSANYAAGTAHFWARELTALGHKVRLMPSALNAPGSKSRSGQMTDKVRIFDPELTPGGHTLAGTGGFATLIPRQPNLLQRAIVVLLYAFPGGQTLASLR